MFFFDPIPWYNLLVWLAVLGILIGLNELLRASKAASLIGFTLVPAALTVLWVINRDNEITSWFTWVKVYSALAGCLIYTVIRFTDYHKKHRGYLILVPAILGLNVLEAVARELQVGLAAFNGMVDGMQYISGGWNYLNALAGLLNLLAISGWYGIRASEGRRRDMLWPDQTPLFIAAYAVWNIAYVYSCAPGNALYSGVALNLAPIIPAMLWAKGTWMQNRAHTLLCWMMWVMTFPYFFATGSMFNVRVSYNPAANWTLSIAALALNVVLMAWQVARAVKFRLNPLKDELWKGKVAA